MEMSERIKQLRDEFKLTLEEVAAYIGVEKSAVSKYERGTVENIPRSKIIKLAKLFDCDPCYLMGFTDVRKQNSDISVLFSELNDDGKKAAIRYLNYLLSCPEYKKSSQRFA